MNRVSIKDIARAADVSHSTVSRALSDSPLVSADTKSRIKRLAREMGYSPDSTARSLVMGRTLTIGVVVTTIADPFVAEVVQAIETKARDHGYSVLLSSSSSVPERELAAVEILQSRRVDGVIVTSSRVGDLYQDHLDRLGVPVVLLNSHRTERGPYTFSVNVDNRHGARAATQHLIELGHKRIAYITGAPDHSDDLERQAGYRKALDRAGLPYDPELVVPGTGRAGGGKRALPQLLAMGQPPTAAFCYNDMTAMGLLLAARESGVDVPRDLSVVGFDDIPFASLVYPSLTTIAQPMPKMGRKTVEMMLALIGDQSEEGAQASNVVVKGKLIVRESSGAPGHLT